MNKIKGLLLKDLLELKSLKKNLLVSIIIYLVIILLNVDNKDMIYFGTSMITFLFSTYALSTFNYDEISKSEKYLLALPIKRKEIIISKYILSILSIFVGLIFGILFYTALYLFKLTSSINIIDYLFSMIAIIYAISLIQCIQIPSIFKFGAEKGKAQIFIIMMIILLLAGGCYYLFPSINLSFIDTYEKLIPYIIILLIIFNYYISYKTSYKIYLKKDI